MNELLHLFLKIAIAYALPSLIVLLMAWQFPGKIFNSFGHNIYKKSPCDILYTIGVIISIALMSFVYRNGWMLPDKTSNPFSVLFNINILLIFSPMILSIVFRKEGFESIYLSFLGWWKKFLLGILLSILSVGIFALISQNSSLIQYVFAKAVSLEKLNYFTSVFLEGAAVAFVFVRLRRHLKPHWAIAIPVLLFAAAHIPNGINNGLSADKIAVYFIFTAAISSAILIAVSRSADIIWIGVVHYFMDISINAF